MDDMLLNLDGKATQKSVEKALRQFRTYELTTPEDFMPKITASYTLEMPAFSNEFNSNTENSALKKVDQEQRAKKYFSWLNKGLKRLTTIERKLLSMVYIDEEAKYNYEIYNELNMSEATFYRNKQKAMYKLALALGLEVYTEEGDSE